MIRKQKKTRTVYVDMDGVIADFFTALADRHGVSHWKDLPDKEKSIRELAGTDFFNRLPKFSTSDRLIEFVHKITNGKWNILSSPLRNDHENSAKWKRVWLDRHGYTPNEAIFTGNKEKYATTNGVPNILVDDKPENIERWKAKGGIGIRYQANENSLQELLYTLILYYRK